MFLAILALLSLVLTLWQWVAAWRFPLHHRLADDGFHPPVTLLKPLKGVDNRTLDCLRSWLSQNYTGKVQVIFGVASAEDPVCEPVRRLIREFPQIDTLLLVCEERLGVNNKVSSLIQMQRLAAHDIIIVSDADVLATPDFFVNAVAPLRDAEVGLVNCFYRLANPTTLGMRWEAVSINADFWSQVLQSQTLAPLDFALGAVMVTRRAQLEKIGGFEAVADHLADDFQLGNRVVHIAEKRIAICPLVVDCLHAPTTLHETWSHQLRWARTIRVCKPGPYVASILSNATLWPVLFAISQPHGIFAHLLLLVCLLVRIITALTLQGRFGQVPGQTVYWWMPPVKDLIQVALWTGALFGNHIVWRGHRYRLRTDGRLVIHDR